jgi:hypothetical protein
MTAFHRTLCVCVCVYVCVCVCVCVCVWLRAFGAPASQRAARVIFPMNIKKMAGSYALM